MMRAAAVLLALLVSGCASAPGSDFSFALIGDLGYTPAQEPVVDRVFADLAKERLAFVVHDGDLGSPSNGSCTNELWARRLGQFQALPHPLIYTPGDNEWTDCHAGEGLPNFAPLERLGALRRMFFGGERSFGQRTIALIRQPGYPENARWGMVDVTFVTLHVVGSNNGRGRAPEGDAEFAARNAADIAWLREGFAAAQAAGSRAIMVIQQANIFPEFPPFPGGGPKEPLGARRGRGPVTPALENFTRVETFGAPNHHWVQVFVSRDDPNVFTFRQRIVESNVQRRSQ